jgi:hypothetical protein
MGKASNQETTVFDFDLAQFDILEKSNEGIEVELVIEKGGKKINTNIWLRVRGFESDAMQDKIHEQVARRIKENAENEGKPPQYSREKNEEEENELNALALLSWSKGKDPWTGKIPYKGEMIDCTKENILHMFKSVPQMKELVISTCRRRDLFFRG